MAELLKEVNKEKKSFKDLGISYEEKAFYDILKEIAHKFGFEYPEDKLLALSADVKKMIDDKSKYTDWANRTDIKAELQMDLILILAEHGYPPVPQDDVFKEIFEQAENFKKYEKAESEEKVSVDTDLSIPFNMIDALVPANDEADSLVTCEPMRAAESDPAKMIPLYTLRAACGRFEDGELPENEGYVEAVGLGFKPNRERHFAIHAMGRSMEPKINDGDICVFEWYKGGSREGDIVLTECPNVDPDTGCRYTIKKYHSEKIGTDGSWEHSKVELLSLNPDYDTIELNDVDGYRTIGVFKGVIK
jgi:phage repressor protein C with HTH and peptisase S24 domain